MDKISTQDHHDSSFLIVDNDLSSFNVEFTLIFHNIKGRNLNGLRKKIAIVAPIIYWQPIISHDSIIIAFDSISHVEKVKNEIKDEKFLFPWVCFHKWVTNFNY